MSEQEKTELLPLAALAKLLPRVRGRKPPNRSTLYRWATIGLKSRSGQRIRLETQFIGGTLCASLADVARLGEQKDDVEYAPTCYRGHREQLAMQKRAGAARQRLVELGILKSSSSDYAQAV